MMLLMIWCLLNALILQTKAQNVIERLNVDCQCDVHTTNSGTQAKSNFYCGDLIFEDNFDVLNLDKWEHEVSLSGNGNGEFQWYRNNRKNTFVRNGILNIKPRLTSEELDIMSATVDLRNQGCTDSCLKKGQPNQVINPITSASIKTSKSFNFKFGRLEIRAKMPKGDWMWPVISLVPKSSVYGPWPASGHITVVESRGNPNIKINGQSVGNDLLSSTLHFGPTPALNKYYTSLYQKRGNDFVTDFHKYQVEWTPEYILFGFDDEEFGVVQNSDDFWGRGFFPAGVKNPWVNGTKMAPFDQEFYLELRLGVGGTNGYFPDVAVNGGGKPWMNNARSPATDFWNGRESWMKTWDLDENSSTSNLQVDYVRIWAH